MKLRTSLWFLTAFCMVFFTAGCDQRGGGEPASSRTASTHAGAGAVTSASQRKGEPRSWSRQPLNELWAYVAEGDSIVDVGLKEAHESEGVRGSRVLMSDRARSNATRNVIRAVSAEIISEDEMLPIVRLKVKNKGTLQALRKMPFVEYVEPGNIQSEEEKGFFESGSLGCNTDSYSGDILTVSPGDKLSPALASVPKAWERSTGSGITVGVVGTGISQYQPQFNANFESGQSGGRSIDKNWTWTEFDVNPRWHDDCGHETRIAGLIAAPRDGESIVGAAYQASLYTVRVDDNVVTQTESDAVRYGIRNASQESDIVNMAFGSYHTWSSIRDEIEYWYDQRDALYIGAAGTSTSGTNGWVTFPARMDEVVAVTGLDSDGTPCSSCHHDDEVLLSAMTNEPTLNPNKNSSANSGDIKNIGGSSGATGMISGIAALVRSRFPQADRQQVIGKLIAATGIHFQGGSKTSSKGWGMPNANCAVGGLCRARIEGPQIISSPGLYTWTVKYSNIDVDAAFDWDIGGAFWQPSPTSGEHSQTFSVYIDLPEGQDKNRSVQVTVTDPEKGHTESVAMGFLVRSQENAGCDETVLICDGPGGGGGGTFD